MDTIIDKIRQLSAHYAQDVTGIRRHLHANPELAFEEHKTAEYIASKLDEYNIPYKQGVAKTGIVALIQGTNPSKKVVALRADMDALPIAEKNNIEYKSNNPGLMHACGHDVHMASLLGAARILKKLSNEFEGTVKLIFQPSEEKYPGGAKLMIEEGALEKPKPAVIWGQHVFPLLEAGKIGLRSGEYMASTDEVFITVKGKGGHAATPELNIDPVPIAATIILELQKIINSKSTPECPTVFALGRVIADGKNNIIPDEVTLDGTLRAFDEKWRDEAHQIIREKSQSIAQSMGGNSEVKIDKGYPVLVNDDTVTANTRKYAEEYLGKENVVNLDLRMTAEDFAYFAQQVPACFYRLGIRNEAKGIISNLHTSTFNVDESCLETGMGLMAWLAVSELK